MGEAISKPVFAEICDSWQSLFMPKIQSCPLCHHDATQSFYRDAHRKYWRCAECRLVFVPPVYHLDAATEKAEYDLHQNSPDDLGYRRFLSRLFNPVHARLKTDAIGLDFGSGPGPTLSVMFAEAGYSMRIYDPFYAHDPSVWRLNYDFITATEVIEHLHHPNAELNRLWTHLKPNGVLGIIRLPPLSRPRNGNFKIDYSTSIALVFP